MGAHKVCKDGEEIVTYFKTASHLQEGRQEGRNANNENPCSVFAPYHGFLSSMDLIR